MMHPTDRSTPDPTPEPGSTWRATRALIGSDFRRLRAHLARTHAPSQGLYATLLPNPDVADPSLVQSAIAAALGLHLVALAPRGRGRPRKSPALPAEEVENDG